VMKRQFIAVERLPDLFRRVQDLERLSRASTGGR